MRVHNKRGRLPVRAPRGARRMLGGELVFGAPGRSTTFVAGAAGTACF